MVCLPAGGENLLIGALFNFSEVGKNNSTGMTL
jgi:hypothetical protein